MQLIDCVTITGGTVLQLFRRFDQFRLLSWYYLTWEWEESLMETGSESVWEKAQLVFVSRLISKKSKRLTYQKLKRNLKFSCLKIYLMIFKRLRDFTYFLSIFEYLAFSIGYYGSLFSVVQRMCTNFF